jgi:Zn-dependent peptidase ImmA (M78 family)/transcriptional regulator with XRE-family HTH domain
MEQLMALDLNALGKRLAEARDNAGLSQEQAAAAIGIPRSAISLIESGGRTLSTLELAGLARLYSRPIASFFEPESGTSSDLLTHCRVAPEFADRPELCQKVEELLGVCREGVGLERLLHRNHRSGPPAYPLPGPSNYAEAVEQGLAVAADERRRLDLGDMPIADIAELVAGQGIWTASDSLPDEMSGLFLRHPDVGLAIIVNKNHPHARKRFSYAHEYAHALMDRNSPVTVTTRENSKELVERRANAFAAAFLMPETGVRDLLESFRAGEPSRRVYTTYDVATAGGATAIAFPHAVLVAHHFEVSYQAACYRLKDLGYMNRDGLKLLLEQEETLAKPFLSMLPKGRTLYGTEPDGRELRGQILPLLLEALKADEITEGKARDIARKLRLSRADTETLLTIGDSAQ